MVCRLKISRPENPGEKAIDLINPGIILENRMYYHLFTLADKCHRHLLPTKKTATFVDDIWRKVTVDQSLQASQRSATPIRLAQVHTRVLIDRLPTKILSATNISKNVALAVPRGFWETSGDSA